MTVRRPSVPAREKIGLAAASPGVRGALELEALAIARARGPLFEFSRGSRLGTVFPPSSARGPISPRTLDPTVQLTYPAIGPGDNLAAVANFAIAGAAGAGAVSTSEIPAGKVMYCYSLAFFHNDPVARRLIITLQEVNTALQCEIWDTQAHVSDYAGGAGAVPTNTVVTLRNVVVPEGFIVTNNIIGLAAGQVGTVEGCVCVLDVGEPPPPGF